MYPLFSQKYLGGPTIPEIRKHYFLEEYCIIAAERKKRPSDFKTKLSKNKDFKECPFCPGNEYKTPKAMVLRNNESELVSENQKTEDWQIRLFPNLFADVVPDPKSPTTDWISIPGHGYHEVIVDSPNHWDDPADFSNYHMALVLRVLRDRYINYSQLAEVNYISIFKNRGMDSGASLNHTHSQIVALPIRPPAIRREMAVITSSSFCLYCNIVNREKDSKRFISENHGWISIAPFYSVAPFEVWILPKGHVSNLCELNKEQLDDLASILLDALRRYKSLFGDLAYNLLMYQLRSDYHFNLRIQPALTKIAGFEKSTEVYINPIPPEQASEELRNALER